MKINLPTGMDFIKPSKQGGSGGRRVDTVRIDKNGSITFGRVVLDKLEETVSITDNTVVIVVSNNKDSLEFYFRDKDDTDIPDGVKKYSFKKDSKGIRKVTGKGSIKTSGIDKLVKLIDSKDVSSYTFTPDVNEELMKVKVNMEQSRENLVKESKEKKDKKK